MSSGSAPDQLRNRTVVLEPIVRASKMQRESFGKPCRTDRPRWHFGRRYAEVAKQVEARFGKHLIINSTADNLDGTQYRYIQYRKNNSNVNSFIENSLEKVYGLWLMLEVSLYMET